jgi:hypothetical protein
MKNTPVEAALSARIEVLEYVLRRGGNEVACFSCVRFTTGAPRCMLCTDKNARAWELDFARFKAEMKGGENL